MSTERVPSVASRLGSRSHGPTGWLILLAVGILLALLVGGILWCRQPFQGIQEEWALEIPGPEGVQFGTEGDLFVVSVKNNCVELRRWRSEDASVSNSVFDLDEGQMAPPYSGSLDSYMEQQGSRCVDIPSFEPLFAFNHDYSLIAWFDGETIRVRGSANSNEVLPVSQLDMPAEEPIVQLEFIARRVLAVMRAPSGQPEDGLVLNLVDLEVEGQEPVGSVFTGDWSIRDRSVDHLVLAPEPATEAAVVRWQHSGQVGRKFNMQVGALLDSERGAESSFLRVSNDGCVVAGSRALARLVVSCPVEEGRKYFLSELYLGAAAFMSNQYILAGGERPGILVLAEGAEPVALRMPSPERVEMLDYRDGLVAYFNGKLVKIGRIGEASYWVPERVALLSLGVGVTALLISLFSAIAFLSRRRKPPTGTKEWQGS